MNRGFDVVIIDEAAQAVRTIFFGKVFLISFLQIGIGYSMSFAVMCDPIYVRFWKAVAR